MYIQKERDLKKVKKKQIRSKWSKWSHICLQYIHTKEPYIPKVFYKKMCS